MVAAELLGTRNHGHGVRRGRWVRRRPQFHGWDLQVFGRQLEHDRVERGSLAPHPAEHGVRPGSRRGGVDRGLGTAYYGSFCYSDTWEFRARNWTNVSEVVEPSPRADAPIAFDSADGYLLLFGGFFVVQYGQPYVRLLNSTWAYSQAPNVFAEVSPPNPESGQSVLFVGLSVGSPSPTSVGWSLGDGTTSPNSTTRHEYAQPDVYRATFRA